MELNSGDYLLRLGMGNGHIVLAPDGKCELRNADGSAMEFVDGHGRKYYPELPRRFFNIYRNEGLIPPRPQRGGRPRARFSTDQERQGAGRVL